jgi:hypothetical protein
VNFSAQKVRVLNRIYSFVGALLLYISLWDGMIKKIPTASGCGGDRYNMLYSAKITSSQV